MWKDNFEESKQHYINWWNHKGIVLSMWEHIQKSGEPYVHIAEPPKAKNLNEYWFNPNYRAERLHYEMSRNSYKADILPVANTQLGPGSLAPILGSELEGREDTIWINPDPKFDGKILFDENNRWWQLHLDLLKACKARSGGNYLVGCPDLVEGLDVLASLKGVDNTLMDLVLDTEQTQQQLLDINKIYLEVHNRIYDIIQENGEMAWCYFSLWAPGKVAKLQVDLSIMISEDDFNTFCVPNLIEQCKHIPFTLYHLDGVNAIRHLDSLLQIDNLKAIQWTPGYGQPQGGDPQWYELYRKIQNAGKSLMINWVKLDELEPLIQKLGFHGLHINVDFKKEEEIERALEIVNHYRKL